MADALDILTLAEAHAVINVPSSVTTQDTEIAQFITAVSRRIDSICGPVVQRTTANELHDGGGSVIRPRKTPVLSITSLVEYTNTTPVTLTAESNTTKSSNDYLLVNDGKHNVKITRRSSNGYTAFPDGLTNVVLNYIAGRYATTATVDAQFKQAAALTLQHLWNGAVGAWTRTPNFAEAVEQAQAPSIAPWDIPMAAKLLIADQMFPPSVAWGG